MLSGGTIITTAILSYFMIGRKIRKHHALGCIFALLGFVLVGFSSMENQSNTDKFSAKGMVVGILMVVVSLFTQGAMSNVEEILLCKYEVDVQRMVGLEGLFGIVWIFIWMMVFSYIPCPDS